MKRACGSRDGNSEHGQSLTETALMLPVLIIVLMGAIDLGRAFFAYVSITNAAREGARFGIAHPFPSYFGDCNTDGTIRYRVCQELAGTGVVIASPTSDIVIECSAFSPESYSATNCNTPQVGGRIRVTVHYTFRFITTEILGLTTLPMTNYATMALTTGAAP